MSYFSETSRACYAMIDRYVQSHPECSGVWSTVLLRKHEQKVSVYDSAVKDAAIEDMRAGMPPKQAALKYGVCPGTIGTWSRRAGLRHKKGWKQK